MNQALSMHRSTVGKKILMAGTGFILLGFVFVHMLGNLKVYMGPEKLDAYGHFLREVGYPALGHGDVLWIFRLTLLAAVAIHLWAVTSLTLTNRKARSVKYKKWTAEESSYASRTMVWGGVIIALFVVFHIAHLTTGQAHPNFEHGAVYANLVSGFQVWWVSVFYIVANLALGLHLYHGFWSMLRTLGANNPRFEKIRRGASVAFALIVVVGNISIPVAVLTGLVS